MSDLSKWLSWLERLKPDPQDAAFWVMENLTPIDMETYSIVHNTIQERYSLGHEDVRELFKVKKPAPGGLAEDFQAFLLDIDHRGLLYDATKLVEGFENPDAYSFWSFMTMLGVALSGRTWVDNGWEIHPCMQTLIVGPSQRSRKSSITKLIKKHVCTWIPVTEYLNQGTPQALYEEMATDAEANGVPKGLIYVSELKVLLEKKEGVNWGGALNAIFDRDTIKRHIIRTGATDIPPGFVSFLGCCNEPWLRETFSPSDIDGGMLARFLTIYQGQSTSPIAKPKKLDSDLYNSVREGFTDVYRREVCETRLSSEAEKIYEEKYNEVWKYDPPTEAILPFYGRWGEHCIRLALLLLHSRRVGEGNSSNAIDLVDMEQAVALMSWLEKSMTKLYQYLGSTEFGDWRYRIVQFVQSGDTWVDKREVLRAFANRAPKGARFVQEVIDDLVVTGNLRINKERTHYQVIRRI